MSRIWSDDLAAVLPMSHHTNFLSVGGLDQLAHVLWLPARFRHIDGEISSSDEVVPCSHLVQESQPMKTCWMRHKLVLHVAFSVENG